MNVREATIDDLDRWLELRIELWPKHSLNPDYELQDVKNILNDPNQVCFLLVDDESRSVGFIEGRLIPWDEKPYVHVEAWYVVPDFRGKGHGSWLMSELEQWTIHRGIKMMTSDTTPEYPISPKAHAHNGFKKIMEVTIFVKDLGGE